MTTDKSPEMLLFHAIEEQLRDYDREKRRISRKRAFISENRLDESERRRLAQAYDLEASEISEKEKKLLRKMHEKCMDFATKVKSDYDSLERRTSELERKIEASHQSGNSARSTNEAKAEFWRRFLAKCSNNAELQRFYLDNRDFIAAETGQLDLKHANTDVTLPFVSPNDETSSCEAESSSKSPAEVTKSDEFSTETAKFIDLIKLAPTRVEQGIMTEPDVKLMAGKEFNSLDSEK